MSAVRFVVSLSAAALLAACNNGSTAAALIRLEPEMAGANCTHGGVQVLTGLDRNSNDALDADEVNASLTRFVCNGAPGAAGGEGPQGPAGPSGPTGTNALSVITDEPAGANCRYGGSRVDVGVDTNGNGSLDMGEVTSTRYLCDQSSVDGIWFGDLTLRTAADLALLDGIQVVAGNLTIEEVPGGVLSLPALRVVSGVISLSSQDGGLLEAPVPLTSISLPELARAGAVRLTFTADLATVTLPKLARVDDLELSYCDALTQLSLPALQRAAYLRVYGNDLLTSLALPALATAEDFNVGYNSRLATLTAPALRDALFYFDVSNNTVLPECAAWRVAAGLSTRPRFGTYIAGNDATTACTAADVCRTVTVAGVTGTLRSCIQPKNFVDAQALCAGAGTGTSLAWVQSDAEWAALKLAVMDGQVTDGWLGYSDAITEGTWTAVGGFTGYSPTSRMDFWAPGEPNGATGENAAELMSGGLVNDLDGSLTRAFLCRGP